MEFIQQRSVLFKKLVVNYFIRNYDLSITKFVHNLNIRNKKLIYVNSNYAIIHNKIINHHYNIKLDETKYSLTYTVYSIPNIFLPLFGGLLTYKIGNGKALMLV
jgi:hypothetical protein